MGYVQYIGANPYSQAVTAGNTTQDVQASQGQTLSLAPALSSWLTTNLSSVWIPVPGFPVPQMTVTSAYMATALNGAIFANATGGAFSIYLANPAAARSSAITIKNIGTTNTVTLSGQFVDDQASVVLAVDQLVTIESDGSAWRMVGSSPQLPISGGSGGSGNTIVRKFPFAFDSPGILTGAPLYVPTIGDVVLDAWVELDTIWDGTTPHGDLLLGTLGVFLNQTGDTINMAATDNTSGGGAVFTGNLMSDARTALAVGEGTSGGQGLYAVAGAAVNFASATPINDGVRILPAKFLTADPVSFVVSQTGRVGGADPVCTEGTGTLYIVTATPA